ncbi:hypothetical protein FACS189430_04210 [Bacteroidia bacterium]|nr:hypothetical protein FACS189430_04210 [Bacteroidia bacterium]
MAFLIVYPFAMNAIEAYFCIGIEASNMGKIFYYRKRPQVKKYKEIYDMYETEFHCDNFSIFLSNLYRDKFYGKVFKPKLGWIEDFELYAKR